MSSPSLAERLLTLVQIDSVIRDEHAICEFFVERAAAWDDYTLERVGRSIALRPKQRHHEQLVCLAGHLDTVPPAGDNPPRIEGDRVFGLGSADMKSGLALMWGLLDDPVTNAFCDLAFVFYDGEEGPYVGNGLGPLLEQARWMVEQSTLAICLEPTDNTLQLGCVGTINATVRFAGRPAHSARPWQGENAIHKAAPVLARLAAFEPREFRYGKDDALLFREVISATLAEGGTARNAVPGSFTLNLNYRYPPSKGSDEAEAFVHELAGGAEGLAEVEIIDHCPAGVVPAQNAALERLRQRCAVPEVAKQAWTDVGRFSAHGVAAVNFGPGENAQCHQPDESTAIALLDEGDALFRRFLAAD
jgi:succinyl-diaminopimelate desuccinylase